MGDGNGHRGIGKKKFCEACNAYMAHEYREQYHPPVYCNACWEKANRSCGLLMLIAVAFVISSILAFITS